MNIFISSKGIFLFFGEVKREKSTLWFQLEIERKANLKYNCWDFPISSVSPQGMFYWAT